MWEVLAESKKYVVSYEYETVSLQIKRKGKEIIIGDFYGDPTTAFISNDESYCVMGGCGLIIYYLKEPFMEYEYYKTTNQWKEIFRKKDEIWWISRIEAGSSNDSVKFITNPTDDELRKCTYEIDVYSLEVKKVE